MAECGRQHAGGKRKEEGSRFRTLLAGRRLAAEVGGGAAGMVLRRAAGAVKGIRSRRRCMYGASLQMICSYGFTKVLTMKVGARREARRSCVAVMGQSRRGYDDRWALLIASKEGEEADEANKRDSRSERQERKKRTMLQFFPSPERRSPFSSRHKNLPPSRSIYTKYFNYNGLILRMEKFYQNREVL